MGPKGGGGGGGSLRAVERAIAAARNVARRTSFIRVSLSVCEQQAGEVVYLHLMQAWMPMPITERRGGGGGGGGSPRWNLPGLIDTVERCAAARIIFPDWLFIRGPAAGFFVFNVSDPDRRFFLEPGNRSFSARARNPYNGT